MNMKIYYYHRKIYLQYIRSKSILGKNVNLYCEEKKYTLLLSNFSHDSMLYKHHSYKRNKMNK